MEHQAGSRYLVGKYRKSLKVLLPKASKQQQQSEPNNLKTVFFDSEDKYIKKILLSQGWRITNHEPSCQLKWVNQCKHNAFSQLGKQSKINHFPNSHTITTKLGLCKTLRAQRGALMGDEGTSHMDFYPRGYDLSEENDCFIKDFRKTAVLNLLKKVMISVEMFDEALFQKIHKASNIFENYGKEVNWVSELQQLYKKGHIFERGDSQQDNYMINGKVFEGLLWFFSVMLTLDCKAGENSFNERQLDLLVNYSQHDPPYTSLQKHFEGDRTLVKSPSFFALTFFFRLYQETRKRIKWFRTDGLRNVWVVKANDSSRGRSIVLISSLEEIKLLNSGTKLIQKYVEDIWIYRPFSNRQIQNYPFLSKIACKKFDIRLWVLVRSFSPLKIYIYHEGYLRVSSEDYQLLDLNDNCTHLTNFTVNWKSKVEKAESSYVLLSQFMDFLEREGIKRKEQLSKDIHAVVLQTLQTADLSVNQSDFRCFELLGFDILLDSQLKPWILEVNMSPACKQRGKLANELEKMGTGLLSLVGLIPPNSMQSLWIQLGNNSPRKTIHKKLSQKMLKGDFMVRSSVKGNSFLSNKDEELTRVSSMLPMISNGMSGHFKTENSNFGDNVTLFVMGEGFSGKSLKRMDRNANFLDSVGIISTFYLKKIRERRKREKGELSNKQNTTLKKKYPLTFLRLVECLIVLSQKSKLKAFKKLKKQTKKKPCAKISRSIR